MILFCPQKTISSQLSFSWFQRHKSSQPLVSQQLKIAITDGVSIVGAGPAGLLLAILLAKSGVKSIKVVEKDSGPTDETRAVFYLPVSMFEFERAGILTDVTTTAALQSNSACFRDAADGKPLFSMPGKGMIALSLDKLAAIIGSHAAQYDDVDILYGHEVLNLGQSELSAWVDVRTANGQKRIESQYIVGCDGGRSFARKALFGEQPMPGFTWDINLVAIDVSIFDM